MRTIITITILAFLYTNVYSQMPLLGDKAPDFKAETTNGKLDFPDDYYAKWKILFSHPAAFTPVCTTELLELAYLQDDFKSMNTEIIVLSTDGLNSHIQWIESMESINYKDKGQIDIKYPLVSDVGLEISKKYGMIHPNSSETKDVRAVFIIDPDDKIRSIFYYPDNVGRNINEIKRTLVALQEVDKKDNLTPANWTKGDDLLMKTPSSKDEADKLSAKENTSMYSLAWYMWFVSK